MTTVALDTWERCALTGIFDGDPGVAILSAGLDDEGGW
jgi:hypothetical protein